MCEHTRICHWVPFTLGGDDDIYESYDNKGKEESEAFDNNYGDFSDEFQMPKVQLFKGVITAGGLFPVNAGNDPTDNFNIWILHTNFRINKGDIKKIIDVEGIESIKPFSRYRVQIVIGLLFDAESVMREVEEALGAEINYSKDIELTSELIDKIELVKNEVMKNRNWLIYVLPSGHIKSLSSNEINSEMRKKITLFRETYDAIGGYIMISPGLL